MSLYVSVLLSPHLSGSHYHSLLHSHAPLSLDSCSFTALTDFILATLSRRLQVQKYVIIVPCVGSVQGFVTSAAHGARGRCTGGTRN